jgi:hypothetical protein
MMNLPGTLAQLARAAIDTAFARFPRPFIRRLPGSGLHIHADS